MALSGMLRMLVACRAPLPGLRAGKESCMSEGEAERVFAPQPLRDFAGLVAYLTGQRGYSLNPCAGHCPDHGGAEHAHLRNADGDMIAWADGRWSPYDLTRPAHLIYPPAARAVRRKPRGWRIA